MIRLNLEDDNECEYTFNERLTNFLNLNWQLKYRPTDSTDAHCIMSGLLSFNNILFSFFTDINIYIRTSNKWRSYATI